MRVCVYVYMCGCMSVCLSVYLSVSESMRALTIPSVCLLLEGVQRVLHPALKDQVLMFRVRGVGFRVYGLRVWGLGFRV